MKIIDLKTFLIYPGIGKNLLYIKIETDEDIHGWGECYTQADRGKSIEVYLQEMKRYLINWNPFEIKKFLHFSYQEWAMKRGSMDFFCAISGIEQALWDIIGKKLEQPTYNLLGGPCREKIRVYANGWSNNIEEPELLAQKAQETIKKGFNAIKVDLFTSPSHLHITKQEMQIAVERVKAVRDAVGPKIDVLVDVLRSLAPRQAIELAQMLNECDPFWYEEPVPIENIDALVEVKSNVKLPIVTGECLYTKSGFREVMEKRAVDIINPDVCNTGGILELKEIAAMAEPYYISVAPHNYNSTTIGLAASLQVATIITNFLIQEYFVFFDVLSKEIANTPFKVKKGCIKIPETPGLGIDINEEFLKNYMFKEAPKRQSNKQYSEGYLR